MPTYQYSCPSCGHFFEQFQSFSDAALTVCPACGGPLRKVFNSVGVVFKGSGFYKTDSRKPETSDSSASPSTSSSSSASSDDGGSKTGSASTSTKSSEKTTKSTTSTSSTTSTPS